MAGSAGLAEVTTKHLPAPACAAAALPVRGQEGSVQAGAKTEDGWQAGTKPLHLALVEDEASTREVGAPNSHIPASIHQQISSCLYPCGTLTGREEEILALLKTGQTYKEIRYGLSLSPSLVNKLARRIFKKLGAHNRAEAVNHWEEFSTREH